MSRSAGSVPFDVLLNATGSTLAFSYGFIALAALVVRRPTNREAAGGTSLSAYFRLPFWPLAPIVALAAIATADRIGAAISSAAGGMPRPGARPHDHMTT